MIDREHHSFQILQRRPKCTVCVVGASNDPSKYGNIIVLNLLSRGYTVWPLNPRETQIAGLSAYASLAALPGAPDIVNFVTPPAVTKKVLEECGALAVQALWLQDGSYDAAVLEAAERSPHPVVADACIMVIAARSQ